MWKAHYRRQPARLFVLLIRAIRQQAGLSWPRSLWVSVVVARCARLLRDSHQSLKAGLDLAAADD